MGSALGENDIDEAGDLAAFKLLFFLLLSLFFFPKEAIKSVACVALPLAGNRLQRHYPRWWPSWFPEWDMFTYSSLLVIFPTYFISAKNKRSIINAPDSPRNCAATSNSFPELCLQKRSCPSTSSLKCHFIPTHTRNSRNIHDKYPCPP